MECCLSKDSCFLNLFLNPNTGGGSPFFILFFFPSKNIVLCDWESEVEEKHREKLFHLSAKCTRPLELLTATSKSTEQIFY